MLHRTCRDEPVDVIRSGRHGYRLSAPI